MDLGRMDCEIKETCGDCTGDEKCLWLAFRNGTCSCWDKVKEAGSDLLGIVRPGGMCSRFESLFCGPNEEDNGLDRLAIGLIAGGSLVVASVIGAASWYWRWELTFFFRELCDNPVELRDRILDRIQTKWNQLRDWVRDVLDNPDELWTRIVGRFQAIWNQLLNGVLYLQERSGMVCDRVRGCCPQWGNDLTRQVSGFLEALGRRVQRGWHTFRARIFHQDPVLENIYYRGFRQFQFDMEREGVGHAGEEMDHWDAALQHGYIPNQDNAPAAAGQPDHADEDGEDYIDTSEEEDERRRQDDGEMEEVEREGQEEMQHADERRRMEREGIMALERLAKARREQLLAERRALAHDAAERRREQGQIENQFMNEVGFPIPQVQDQENEIEGQNEQIGLELEEANAPPAPPGREVGLSPHAANVLANVRRPQTRSRGSPGAVPPLPPRI